MSDRLAALEKRGDDLEVFYDCQRQANAYIAREGTQKLVDELRSAVAEKRRIKLGTPNTLILLAHIDQIEAELAKVLYGGVPVCEVLGDRQAKDTGDES